jgi:hypothetical protein
VATIWHSLAVNGSPFFVTVDYGNPGNPLPADIRARTEIDDRWNTANRAILRRALESGLFTIVPGSRRAGLIVLRRLNPS